MSSPQPGSQYDTQVLNLGNDEQPPRFAIPEYPGPGQAPAQAPADPATYWYGRFRRERRKSRFVAGFAVLATLAAVGLGALSFTLYQANSVTSQLSALVPGLSGVIGDGSQSPDAGTGAQAPSSQAPSTDGTATGSDLKELQDLAASLKNADGSINPVAIAGLAGKLGTLAQDPEKLNSLLDQAEAQGVIDPQVAGLLRGLLAQQG
jgi:hypothetical protein